MVEAATPTEDNDDCVSRVLAWAGGAVVPLAPDPCEALARVHETSRARLATVRPGSSTQLAAYQASIWSSCDVDQLIRWLDHEDLPKGLTLDLDLRWQLLVRLATLGAVDRSELQQQLEASSPPPVRASSTPEPLPHSQTRRPRPGRGHASWARSRCPTTSSRQVAPECGELAKNT